MKKLFSIFRVFKENKQLTQENRDLKLKLEALNSFKSSFVNFYNDLTSTRFFEKSSGEKIILTAATSVSIENLDVPMEVLEDTIVRDMAFKLKPFIQFELMDSPCLRGKELVGKVIVHHP